MGDVGGTMQVLLLAGAVMVSSFSNKLFYAALIKNIYHVSNSFGLTGGKNLLPSGKSN